MNQLLLMFINLNMLNVLLNGLVNLLLLDLFITYFKDIYNQNESLMLASPNYSLSQTAWICKLA